MPGVEFVALADVDQGPTGDAGDDEGHGGHRSVLGPPCVDPAGQLPGEAFVADGQALADDVIAILVAIDDEHDLPVPIDQPAEPAGELRAELDRQRAGDVAGREGLDGSDVDDDGPPGDEVTLSWSRAGKRP